LAARNYEPKPGHVPPSSLLSAAVINKFGSLAMFAAIRRAEAAAGLAAFNIL